MANQKLSGFLGMPFGMSKGEVTQILQTRQGCIYDIENSNDESLFFNGIKFAGRDTMFVMLTFYGDKFCKASVYIDSILDAKAISIYQEIKNEINSKYFFSDEDYETYKTPYEKNDGYTESAISLGKASFSCFWKFTDHSPMENYISLKINESLNIVIAYEDGYLMDLYIKNIKENDSLDY